MITRDESAMLAQAIESVRSVVSEIIVVDTGSVDGTHVLAKKLGARVITSPWTGDFSVARNTGLAAATGDWILVLDADEAIAKEQLPLFNALVKDSARCFTFAQRHYINDHCISGFMPANGEYPAWELTYLGFFETAVVRFFPNRKGVTYTGRVHEVVEPSIASIAGLSIHSSSIVVHHYGSSPEVLERKQKHRMYQTIGEAKVQEHPDDWKAFFELGVVCNRPEQREESVKALRRSLELNSKHLPSWTNLGYVLCELGRYQEAVEALHRALLLQKYSPEAHCNLGVVYLRSGQLYNAEMHLRVAIKVAPRYINALLNLTVVFAAQGKISEALACCTKTLEFQPKNPRAQEYLKKLHNARGPNAAVG